MKKIYLILMCWRNILSYILYCLNRDILDSDIKRYVEPKPKKIGFCILNRLLLTNLQIRSVFYYRTRNNPILSMVNHIFIRPLPGIEIGGGLLVFHRRGCEIFVDFAGDNLTVGQGSTIGVGKPDIDGRTKPILGDNVWVCTNAMVFGPINIGDNVTIGAGSLVNKSVPSNCTVVGNPARIVKKNGMICNEPL